MNSFQTDTTISSETSIVSYTEMEAKARDEASVRAFFDFLKELPDDEVTRDFMKGRPWNVRLNRTDFNDDAND